MTSLPVAAAPTQNQIENARNGDAVVVRSVAALLVLLALAALLVVPQPASYGVAATVAVGALALFVAARWRPRA